jgi:hypothetical protein
MKPKYALSQGNVKKKKDKEVINFQKKSPASGAMKRQGPIRGL